MSTHLTTRVQVSSHKINKNRFIIYHNKMIIQLFNEYTHMLYVSNILLPDGPGAPDGPGLPITPGEPVKLTFVHSQFTIYSYLFLMTIFLQHYQEPETTHKSHSQ